jgi:hypothetical protein
MPKRQSHRRRKSGGGWFDGTSSTNTYSTSTYPPQSSTGSSWWNSLMGTSRPTSTMGTGMGTMGTGMGTMGTMGTGYDSSTMGTGYNSSTMGTGYNSSTMGTGYNSSTMGTGYNSSTMGTGYDNTMNTSYDSNTGYDPMRGKRIMGNQVITDSRFRQRSIGGKTRGRQMKGGFQDNTSTTDLAAHAAPFSGPTAEPHNLVGGRTRRRGRKICKKCGKKSCKKCGKTYRNRK